MKTKVTIAFDDHHHNEFKKGETGYIDGYLRDADNRPYAVVVIGDRLTLISFYCLIVESSKQTPKP